MKTDLDKIEELTKEFNLIRVNNQNKLFTRKEIIEILKFIPSSKNYTRLIIDNGLIFEVRRGLYEFTEKPIHWTLIKKTMEDIRSKIKTSNSKWYYKNKNKSENLNKLEKSDIAKILLDNNISINQIAKYLVATGNFSIKVKTVSWEEIQ